MACFRQIREILVLYFAVVDTWYVLTLPYNKVRLPFVRFLKMNSMYVHELESYKEVPFIFRIVVAL